MHPILGQHRAAFLCMCSVNPELDQGVGGSRPLVLSWVGRGRGGSLLLIDYVLAENVSVFQVEHTHFCDMGQDRRYL